MVMMKNSNAIWNWRISTSWSRRSGWSRCCSWSNGWSIDWSTGCFGSRPR